MRAGTSSFLAMRESIVGFIPSASATSESLIGPRLATVSKTEISVGVNPEPAFVGRSRLEILFTAARKRGASSANTCSSAIGALFIP
jgi:hypothetical protein